MILKGKGFYIWQIPNCENGDPLAIAETAYNAGLTHVLIKIANGIYDYNYDTSTGVDLVTPVANALHKKNIAVWGWHYVFGDLPKDEAKAAIRQINKIPLDGYVIDAESEYKGKYTPCRIFMGELRSALPDYPIALSSFRYPKYHMDLPWEDFLKYCDINMPQVYWEQSNNPAYQLERSQTEFETTISPILPYIPTGAAYCAGGWCPTESEILEFLDKAVSLNMSAANFWSWDYCRAKLPQIWNSIASYEWPSAPNPEKTIIDHFIELFNLKNYNELLALYAQDAIHITASRTIQGSQVIKEHYQQIFSRLQSGLTFTISNISGNDETIHFSWNIEDNTRNILQGEDTIGISDNQIIYHYSTIEI